MKVKGTAVRVMPDFVKKKYPAFYDTWLSGLKSESKKIFENPIFATEWYELVLTHSHPTRVLADIVGKPAEDLAYEIGLFSAEEALTGVYNIFLKIAKLKFTLKRIPDFFRAYYEPFVFEFLQTGERFVKFKFGYTNSEENLLYYRNKGWATKMIEMTGQGENPEVNLDIQKYKDDLYFAVFAVKW